MDPRTLLADLLANAPYERPDAPFSQFEVTGPDAGEFLHRLSTQDVLGLADGVCRPAAFLDAKGKLLVTCLVARVGAAFWLEVAAEQADRLAALLERYHFTEKLQIARLPAGGCVELVQAAGAASVGTAQQVGDVRVLRIARRGVVVERRHGATTSTANLEAPRSECLRMLGGWLRVGVETEATTLALEADLDDHISTTKGCYTGQEIVARIHTYGHTNRKACLLWLAGRAEIASAQPLHDEDGLPVGRVLHAVAVPGHDASLGIGYLPKDFQNPGTALRRAAGGLVTVIGYEPLPAQASTT